MEDDPKVRAILKALTTEQKLNAAAHLYWTARALKAAGFRAQHPEWSEERIQKEVRDVFLFARG
jgi:hypothetical protein